MKKILFFLVYSFILVNMSYGQNMAWNDPVPVTDSLTDNVNISMPYLFGPHTDSVYAVWEKPVNSSTTAIFGRNLHAMSEPFQILSQPGVHFRHPVMLNWPSGDTLFLVLYETNLNGNWDIYYSKYLRNGTVAPPVPVCNTVYDEINFTYNDNCGIAWEQEGNILFKNFVLNGFPSPVTTLTFDTGECHHPVLSNVYCAWLKGNGTDTLVKYSIYQNFSTWSPAAILTDGVNNNLSCGDCQGNWLTWQKRDGSFWRLEAADLYYPDFLPVNDFPGVNNSAPTFTTAIIITKKDYPFTPGFYSFASDAEGNNEIYVNQHIWDTIYTNISNHAGNDVHPLFYSSFIYIPLNQTIFLFWESWRNNHWQIWMSHLDIPEGINDGDPGNPVSLENHPNPFSELTTITYRLRPAENNLLTIFNSMGIKIRSLESNPSLTGNHSVTWDGRDENGKRVAPGIYICSLRTKDKVIQRKISVL
jgi:hypothetical protein